MNNAQNYQEMAQNFIRRRVAEEKAKRSLQRLAAKADKISYQYKLGAVLCCDWNKGQQH